SWLTENFKHVSAHVPGSYGRFITLDGLVSYAADTNGAIVGYTHVFPHGAIESVTRSNFHPDSTSRHQGYVRAFSLEEDTLIRVEHFIEAERALGVKPPIVVAMTLLEVQGYDWIADGI